MKLRLPIKSEKTGELCPTGKTDNTKKSNNQPKKKINRVTVWTINITVITFFLSAFFSYLSEITTSKAHISIAFLLLLLLVILNIIFDAIGVAATSCDLAPILSMASRKVPGSKIAVKLVKNAERVSSICCDVLGDICGIVSGSCTLAIVLKLTIESSEQASLWISILCSSLIAAFTVGGKAVFKTIAVKYSKELILFVSKILTVPVEFIEKIINKLNKNHTK